MAMQTYNDELEAARDAESEVESGEVDSASDLVGADDYVAPGTQTSFFDVGGKRATKGTLTVRAKSLESGAYRKGDRLKVTGYVVIDDVGDRDKRDKATGMVTDATQRYSAFWDSLEIVEV